MIADELKSPYPFSKDLSANRYAEGSLGSSLLEKNMGLFFLTAGDADKRQADKDKITLAKPSAPLRALRGFPL